MIDDLSVSVVIPVGPDESSLSPMLGQLDSLQHATEIIFVFCPQSVHLAQQLPVANGNVKHVLSDKGRGRQLNRGAEHCTADYIWYLHLDSRITTEHWQALIESIRKHQQAFYYFDLKFLEDGNGPMWLNGIGANLRSRWLGVPFGDQGFCLHRAHIKHLGGYPEQVVYGEDHLLVWKARQAGVRLQRIQKPLITSARKYADQGWFKLTLKYQWYWLKQALPQLATLLRIRMLRK